MESISNEQYDAICSTTQVVKKEKTNSALEKPNQLPIFRIHFPSDIDDEEGVGQ